MGEINLDLKNALRELAFKLGADLFGVTSGEGLQAPKGHNPRDVMPDVRSIIVLGMRLLYGQVNSLPLEKDGTVYFASSPRQDMYAGHNDLISRELDVIGLRVARMLESKGFRAYHQMSSRGGIDNRFLISLLSLKHIAAKAGLGEIGCSSLLITPKFGPRVRLNAILTDAELEVDQQIDARFCETCKAKPCIAQCPSGALQVPHVNQKYKIDKFVCNTYLNTRPACAICVKVCPIGLN